MYFDGQLILVTDVSVQKKERILAARSGDRHTLSGYTNDILQSNQ